MNNPPIANSTCNNFQSSIGTIKYVFCIFVILFLTSCQASHDAAYSAHVWEDLNGNGIQDDGEPPMEEVVIQIIDPATGILWGREVTNAKGNVNVFSAGGSCGDYQIYLSVPNGYRPTTKVLINTPNCEAAQFGVLAYP